MFGFFSTCNFRLLAVRTQQVLSSAKPGARKTKRTFSWSELNSLLGSTEHPQVNLSPSFWSLSAGFLFLSLLCSCYIFHRREPKLENGNDARSSISTSLRQLDTCRFFSGVRWVRESQAHSFSFTQSFAFLALPGFIVFSACAAFISQALHGTPPKTRMWGSVLIVRVNNH